MKKVQKILVIACLAVSGLVFMAARGMESHSTEPRPSANPVGTPSSELVAGEAIESSNAAAVVKDAPARSVKSDRDLTMKEKIAFKAAEKSVKRQMKTDDPSKTAKKSQLVALLLCVFLGYIGVHRFYLGYTGIGLLMLFTAGLCGILTLIDFIRIITGDLQPRDGSYDETF